MTDRSFGTVARSVLALALVALGARVALALPGDPGDDAARLLARAAFWLGAVVPQLAFLSVQAVPGGRAPTPLWGDQARNDAWLFLLVLSQIVTMLPILLGEASAVISNVPELAMTLVTTGLLLVRTRQLRAGGDASRA